MIAINLMITGVGSWDKVTKMGTQPAYSKYRNGQIKTKIKTILELRGRKEDKTKNHRVNIAVVCCLFVCVCVCVCVYRLDGK